MHDEKLSFTYEDPRGLVQNTWNPNEMSPEAEAKLRNSLEQNGHIRPILVRELEDGTLEIVGGAHRVELSIELGHEQVPVLNLGRISDEQAKKALLLDNSRYGEDDAGKLSELLSDLGEAVELSEWLSMDLDDLETLVGVNADLDAELDALDALSPIEDDHTDLEPATREIQTHQTLKFKVPKEDAEFVAQILEGVMTSQKIIDSDSLVRSGEALMWLCRHYAQGDESAPVAGAEEVADPAGSLDLDLSILEDLGGDS